MKDEKSPPGLGLGLGAIFQGAIFLVPWMISHKSKTMKTIMSRYSLMKSIMSFVIILQEKENTL